MDITAETLASAAEANTKFQRDSANIGYQADVLDHALGNEPEDEAIARIMAAMNGDAGSAPTEGMNTSNNTPDEEDYLKAMQRASQNPDIPPENFLQELTTLPSDTPKLPEQDGPVDIEQCIGVVEGFLTKLYGENIPEHLLQQVNELKSGKVTKDNALLASALKKLGHTDLQITFTSGLSTPEGILLREDAKNKTAVHEFMHALCNSPAALEPSDAKTPIFSTVANEAVTEFFTYLALQGVDLHDPTTLYKALDFNKMQAFAKDAAGSYRSGFLKLGEQILGINEKGIADLGNNLPELFEAYTSRDFTKFKETFGRIATISMFSELSEPHMLDTIPVATSLNAFTDVLQNKYPQYQGIFSKFRTDLTNARYLYPETVIKLLGENRIKDQISSFDLGEDGVAMHINTMLGPVLRTDELLPNNSSKEMFVLWQVIKHARLTTDKPIQSNSEFFDTKMVIEGLAKLSESEQLATIPALCKALNVKMPTNIYERLAYLKTGKNLGLR